MKPTIYAPLALVLLLAGCGGNPFATGGGSGGGGGDPGTPAPSEVPDSVRGTVNTASFTPGDPTITIDLNSQDASDLEATYVRNAAFDVQGYTAYTYQETTSNRYVVALVQEVGSAKAVVAVDAGQFANYYGGGLYSRADAFTMPARGIINYSGTYAGLLNVGEQQPGPGGTFDPERAYRTEGRVLVTADFTNMELSGGVDNRTILDLPGQTLEAVALFATGITPEGTFEGTVQRADVTAGAFVDAGTYAGTFAGTNASEIATLLVFSPLGTEPLVKEHGMFVLSECTIAGGPACP
jgi:hypothetical protein